MIHARRKPHSFLRHLAWGMWLDHDSERCWMAAYAGYYDASGRQDADGAIVVAGLVATEAKWLRFETEWNAILRSFGVSAFHRTDLNAGRGGFKTGWSDIAKVQDFLQSLVAVIRQHVVMTFSIASDLSMFNRVKRRFRLQESTGGAYPCCALVCVRRATEWVLGRGADNKIVHFPERGDKGLGRMLETARRDGFDVHPLPKFNPQTGQRVRPLEAADLFSWEYRRAFTESPARITTGTAYLPSFKPIVLGLKDRHEASFLDERKLLELCKSKPEEFPRRSALDRFLLRLRR